MNTRVEFKVAKLLKEKGFDSKRCIGYYTKDGEFFYFDVDDISSSYNSRLDNLIVNSIDPLYCLAPTIAEIVTWLYEKHGIWISVFSTDDIEMFSYKISCSKQGPFYSPNYNSPKEAYQEAISYTLKNLIK